MRKITSFIALLLCFLCAHTMEDKTNNQDTQQTTTNNQQPQQQRQLRPGDIYFHFSPEIVQKHRTEKAEKEKKFPHGEFRKINGKKFVF